MTARSSPGRRLWPLVGAITLAGFALRLMAAQGALWLDEAWSAVFAEQAGTPIGIFLWVNHDNNHHLNTLWLQLVGIDAAPVAARALSIVSGTATIPLIASIGARRGAVLAIVLAALFALSPALVTLGSEARGYAPMLLALVAALSIVDRHIDGDAPHDARTRIAICFVLGLLAQLTMVVGIVALIGWAAWARGRHAPWPMAVREVSHLFVPALVAVAATLLVVFVPGWAAGTGFHLGSHEPFGFRRFADGYGEMLRYTLGVPVHATWLVAVAIAAVVLALFRRTRMAGFAALAIIGFPLAVILCQAINSGHPRYYLVPAVALLCIVAELVALAWARGGWRRLLCGTLLLAFAVGGIAQDIDLIRNRRGDPRDGRTGARRARLHRSQHGIRHLHGRRRRSSLSAAHHRQGVRPCPLLADRCGARPAHPI